MKIRNIFFFVLLVFTSTSCKDFMEDDISASVPELIAPVYLGDDKPGYKNYTQTFWWKEIEGISKYNIQIVKGTFDSTQALVLDSNLAGNKLKYSLSPGTYSWRVRGFNSGSKTAYTVRKIKIDTASFNEQIVTLESPETDLTIFAPTKDQQLILKWQSLFRTKYYVVEIDTTNGSFTAPLKRQVFTNTYIFPADSLKNLYHTFTWRIKANDGSIYSAYSNPNRYTITKKTVPLGESTSTGSMILKWSKITGFSKYRVFITNITDNSNTDPVDTDQSSYTMTNPKADAKYRWTVAAVDSYGNISDTSGTSKTLVFKK